MKIELGGGIRTMEDLEAGGRHGRLADGHRLRCGQQSGLCPEAVACMATVLRWAAML